MIKYSVIMPIYNAINFIEINLKKFEKIHRDDVELIIINDGSTDLSIEVIKKYKNKIKNLTLINQENKGVSYSRNKGIKNAKGKYITFLDCDDSIEDNIFEKIDEIYTCNYDVIRYGFNIVNKKNRTKQIIVKQKVVYDNPNKNSELLKLLYTTNKFNAVWNQFIKKEILEKSEIYFDEKHKYAEDFEFNKKLLNYINSICLMPECLYDYYIFPESISRSEKKENIMKCIKDSINIHTQSYIECKKEHREIVGESFKNISLEFMTTIRRVFFIKGLKIKEIEKIFENIRKEKYIQILIKEKKIYNYKSNIFIDSCIYKEANNIKIIFYKYYFILKEKIKNTITQLKII